MNEASEGKSPVFSWFVLLAVGGILYVLSIGPAALLARPYGAGSDVIRVVYAPVIWLHDHTILARPLEAYVSLWGL